MPVKDYYRVLNVPPSATLEQIKRAYRRLVRQYHPDLNKTSKDNRRIKQLNEAYEILSDSAKRAAYDVQRLEEIRNSMLKEVLSRQQEQAKHEPEMTWMQGLVGFVSELKKGMRDD